MNKILNYFNDKVLEVGYAKCEECGATNTIFDVHHIIFRSEKPKHPEIDNPRNLILVCRKCHDRLHGKTGLLKKEVRRHLVISRKLDEIFN